MTSIKQRIYSYLILTTISILSLLYINNVYTNNMMLEQDCRTVLPNVKLRLICNLYTNREYFILPSLVTFLHKEKITNPLGIEYDQWAVHNYDVKIKVSNYPNRYYIPKGEYIEIGGPVLTDIDYDNKVTYIIPIKNPQEVDEIIISSYTDHWIGVYGEISYLFNRVYSPKITMKEFNEIMVCFNKTIYQKETEKKNGE